MRQGVKRGVRVRPTSFRAEGTDLFSQGPAVNVLGFAVSLCSTSSTLPGGLLC